MTHSMFHLGLPVLEKMLRPMIVYLVLISFLRLFGKRELAQLNPFDLVVLLSLANTVQNAIIGDDNSVTGGIIGAFSLLSINWILMRLLYRMPKLNAALEGQPTVLIHEAQIDDAALESQSLTKAELITALHRQGVDSLSDIKRCTLEPSGNFYIERYHPGPKELDRQHMLEELRVLTAEVRELRSLLTVRG